METDAESCGGVGSSGKRYAPEAGLILNTLLGMLGENQTLST